MTPEQITDRAMRSPDIQLKLRTALLWAVRGIKSDDPAVRGIASEETTDTLACAARHAIESASRIRQAK